MACITSEGTLKGMAPYLCNRYTEKARPGKLREEELLEEATRRVYRDPDTQALVCPAWNLKKCFMDGARLGEVKHGKKCIVPVPASLVDRGRRRAVWARRLRRAAHLHGRIPPRTGPMVKLYRPKLDAGWTLTFRLLIADTTIHPDTLKQIISFAGLLAGIGAWRPEYGRFMLERFEVSGFGGGGQAVPVPAKARKKAVA